MRIYMVMTVLAPIGGIEAALLPLALELKRRGHDVIVHLITPLKTPNQNADVLRDAGIPIVVAPDWQVSIARLGTAWRLKLVWLALLIAVPGLTLMALADSLLRRRSWVRSWQGAAGVLRGKLTGWLNFESFYYMNLGAAFSRQRPDVVHVHGWGCGEDPPGLLAWLKHQSLSVPIVFTEHNSPDPSFMAPIPNAPMNLADDIIAVSQAARAGLQQVGLATRPIHIIPYSVGPLPVSPAARDPGKFVVVCVARLMPQKGHRYLLEAFAELRKQVPGAKLLLAGAGELQEDLETQCRMLGIRDHVEFLGIVTRSNLPTLYARSDVVVLASLWEGLPVTLIEALSAGMPIVAANAGGNAELVIDGENGFVVPSKDSQTLAARLLTLANDPLLRSQMSMASLKHFEQGGFSPAAITDRHLEVYMKGQNAAR